jgi:hypothetical protein
MTSSSSDGLLVVDTTAGSAIMARASSSLTASGEPPLPEERGTAPRLKDPPPPPAAAAAANGSNHRRSLSTKESSGKSPHKRRSTHKHSSKKDDAKGRHRSSYRDSVLVTIPLDRTVDLSSIVATCRDRTLGQIYDRYPQLNKNKAGRGGGTAAARYEVGGRGLASSTANGGSPPRESDDDDDDEAVEEGATNSNEKPRSKKLSKDVSDAATAAAGESSKEDADLSSSGGNKKAPGSPTTRKKVTAVKPPPQQLLQPHVPQKKDFGSMIEYLEAKYVQGVTVPDADLLVEEGASEEGNGSVYSENSFFDDTDLQRGVAGQVLAHSTTTRVELLASNNNNDDDFFVNVGNLEVEESEFTKDHYDPLADLDSKKTAKKPSGKKRKKPDPHDGATHGTAGASTKAHASASGTSASGTSAAATTTTKKKKPKTAPTDGDDKSKASKGATKDGNKKSSSSKSLPLSPASPIVTPSSSSSNAGTSSKASPSDNNHAASGDSVALKVVADEKKDRVDELYNQLVQLIPTETFPKRKTKERVLLRCPDDKKPGDSVQFSNPHVPGQRLKVQIPKSAKPGGTFKAHVPVHEELDENTDYNKLSRDFHLLIDDYARAFDDWCDALGSYRKSVDGNDCSAHFEKRTKFDKLSEEFPKDLKTPVDKAYLQKILRRARQNRSKRENNAKRGGDAPSASASVTASPAGSAKSESKGGGGAAAAASSTTAIHAKAQEMIRRHSLTPSTASHKDAAAAADSKNKSKPPETIRTKPMGIPSLFRDFMRKKFDEADFALET